MPFKRAQACLFICVRENRKSFQRTDRRTFKGRTFEARSCHTLRHRHSAHRRLTPLSRLLPGLERHQKLASLKMDRTNTQSKRSVTGWETQVVTL